MEYSLKQDMVYPLLEQLHHIALWQSMLLTTSAACKEVILLGTDWNLMPCVCLK